MRIFTALLVVTLAGCSASLPPIDPARLPSTPEAFKEGDGRWTLAAPAEAQPRGDWWKAFADPVLDELVERADPTTPAFRSPLPASPKRALSCARPRPIGRRRSARAPAQRGSAAS